MTDAKARLLKMIADEPHMGGGGLLKAVGKAQKVAKAAEEVKAAAKAMERVAAPQETALLLAQQRAALPIAQGGLGLPASNTPTQRAAAMGFTKDRYHGSLHDIKKFDVNKASTESHAGKGVYSTDSPEDASLNYASIYGPDVDAKINRVMDESDRDWRRIYGRLKDETLTPRQQEILLRETLSADNLGVVYPLKVRSDKPIHLDAPEERPLMVGPFERYDEATDQYMDTPHTDTFQRALDEFSDIGGETNPIREFAADYGDENGVLARDLFNAVKKQGGSDVLIDPYSGELVSGGVAAGDFLKHFGVDEISHTPQFRSPQLNIGREHTISLDPENVRSRFAAFDPWRRNAAIAALMGVEAPDLLADEKKAAGGDVHMAGGGATHWSLGNPEQFAKNKADRLYPKHETMNRGVKAVKTGLDAFNALIDQGVPVKDLVGNLTEAIPFVGPDLRKRLESANVTLPVGFQRSPANPQVATGVDTATVPVSAILENLRMSDLTGGTGASNVLSSIGKGYAPNTMDVLDALQLGGMGLEAANVGVKGARKTAGALSNLAKSEAGYKLAQKALQYAPAAQPMNIVKEPGGNWLSGSVEKALQPLKTQRPTHRDEALMLGGRWANEVDDPAAVEARAKDAAFNKWIDSNLTNYVKKQMATPDDPVRKLAEQGITHKASLPNEYQDAFAPTEQRINAGFPAEGIGQSPLARSWENASDEAVAAYNAGEIQNAPQKAERINAAKQKVTQELEALNQKFENHIRNFGLQENEVQGLMKTMTPLEKGEMIGDDSFSKANMDYLFQRNAITESHAKMMENNPWITKVDPNSSVYSPHIGDLGFDHIVDVLRQDLDAGRIRPEQMNKISMEQAVRRTHEFDQEMAKKMAATQAKVTEGMPVHKEYPEGYKWIELAPSKMPEGWTAPERYSIVRPDLHPDTLTIKDNDTGRFITTGFTSEADANKHLYNTLNKDSLATALKYEGDTMGHCVGGYCPDVEAGRSRIFSLRDAKGEPHVTVEVRPQPPSRTQIENAGTQRELGVIANRLLAENPNLNYADADRLAYEQLFGKQPDRIVQIKGKQNRAPKEEYLPYVQDFVKSGKWSDVGDLQNAGLYSAKDVHDFMPENFTMSKNARMLAIGRAKAAGDMPDYMTKPEYEAMLLKHAPEDIWAAEKKKNAGEDDELLRQLHPPEEGMAEGGEVKPFFEEKSAKQRLIEMIAKEPHMAGGGLLKAVEAAQKISKVEHPLVFPRAAAKSIEDIRPIAQRMAEQMTGEFVRQHPNPKVTTNPVGKSRKQFEREQSIPLETRNLVPEREAQPINYEDYMGHAIVGVPGDPTLGGVAKRGSLEEIAQPTVELTRVGDITPDHPVPLFGGPRYGDENKFWASNLSAAVPVQNSVNELAKLYESPVLGKYIKMGEGSENFALHNLDALLSIQKPETLNKTKMAELTKRIRAGSPEYGKFPGFTGFQDPADVLLQAQMDSNLRKHIAETLTKPTITNALGLPNGLDVVAAITHPELRNLEIGSSGFSVGRMAPGQELVRGQSSHPTYDTDIPGSFLGRSKYPTPYEIAFPDTTAYARSKLKPGVNEFNMMKMLGPRERIDQQYIDEMKMYEDLMKQYTGKKKGGLARTKKVKRHGNTVPH